MTSRFVQNSIRFVWLACAAVSLAACQTPSAPPLVTAADSLAFDMTEAAGGLRAWAEVPTVRFDWVVRTDSAELRRVRHLWDRVGDRARVEWPVGQDSVMVALISPDTFAPASPAGSVALSAGGTTEMLSGNAALDGLRDAHARWVNDTYWMIAHLKVFDPGVTRALAPDSGAAVLALSFGDVGLTPGDRYWLRTGADGMTGWTYLLEGDTTAARWTWSEPRAVDGAASPVRVWTVKRKTGDAVEIVTEPLVPPAADPALFQDLAPRLG